MAEGTFAQRLTEAMRQRGLKQIDVVRRAPQYGIHLGKSHVSQYVSGKTVPRADTARALAAMLGVNQAWLLGESDTMAPSQDASSFNTEDAPSVSSPSLSLIHI